MPSRRSFLAALAGAGLVAGVAARADAHHKPGHPHGPASTSTTLPATTTTGEPVPTFTTTPTTVVVPAQFVYDVLVLAADSNATAQGKIDAAASNAIIGFEGATHYERDVTPKAVTQRFRGNPNGSTVFDGSRLVTGWTGSNPWVANHTVTDRGVTIDVPTRSPDAGTQYCEELFYETPGQLSGWTRKTRTGTPSTATPAAGKWTMDYTSGTLRVVEDPTGVNVRLSVTAKAIGSPSTTAGGFVIEDITFAKYATDVFQGAAGQGTDHRDWTYRRCAFLDCHGANVYLGPGDVMVSCRVAYAGNSGFQNECELGGYVAGQVIDSCEVAYNLQAPWDWGWGGGGSKFDLPASGSGGLVIRNCWWHHNRGATIWTDLNETETSTGNLIESNLVEDGEVVGIFHEIGNPTTLIRWNRVRNMGTGAVSHLAGPTSTAENSAGIDVSNSRNTTVAQNVVDTCRTGIMVRDDDRSPTLNGANVTDNSVKATDGNTVKLRPGAGSGPIATCGADNNRYWSNVFSYNNTFGMSFADWQAARSGPGLTGALDPNGTGNLTGAVTDPATFHGFTLARYGPGV